MPWPARGWPLPAPLAEAVGRPSRGQACMQRPCMSHTEGACWEQRALRSGTLLTVVWVYVAVPEQRPRVVAEEHLLALASLCQGRRGEGQDGEPILGNDRGVDET